ncbi:hypothetical protein LCGC14_2775760, partial [marine sediment metagenome]
MADLFHYTYDPATGQFGGGKMGPHEEHEVPPGWASVATDLVAIPPWFTQDAVVDAGGLREMTPAEKAARDVQHRVHVLHDPLT